MTLKRIKKSFEQWCKENNRLDIIERWDYDLNVKKPTELNHGQNIYVYLKCPRGLHKSKRFLLSNLSSKNKINSKFDCDECNSIGQYLLDRYGKNGIKKYWSSKNNIDPFLIPKGTRKKFYMRCQDTDYHPDYLITMNNFLTGARCPYCARKILHFRDSFGYWCATNIENFMEDYWSDKNTDDPFTLAINSKKKIWIKCNNTNYHEDYQTSCFNFYKGKRCPYCSSKKIHYKDSLGYRYPISLKYWDWENNKKSPYEIAMKSNKKVNFTCPKHGHFFISPCDFVESIYHCPKCALENKTSSLELKVQNYLKEKNIKYLTEYDCTVKPINPKTNKILPYDNQLIDYKIIIEVNGSQHYHFNIKWYGESYEERIANYEYSLWKDEYKKQFAQNRGYVYLVLPYYVFDDKDTYKKIINNIIKQYTYND